MECHHIFDIAGACVMECHLIDIAGACVMECHLDIALACVECQFDIAGACVMECHHILDIAGACVMECHHILNIAGDCVMECHLDIEACVMDNNLHDAYDYSGHKDSNLHPPTAFTALAIFTMRS